VNDYIVIESKDLVSLCKRVIEGMDDGYYPVGSLVVYPFEDDKGNPCIFYQAMASYKQ
jgi:hypothetical protein